MQPPHRGTFAQQLRAAQTIEHGGRGKTGERRQRPIGAGGEWNRAHLRRAIRTASEGHQATLRPTQCRMLIDSTQRTQRLYAQRGEQPLAIGLREVFDIDDIAAEPFAGRNDDLEGLQSTTVDRVPLAKGW